MQLIKHRDVWTAFAPAKLNLFFEVFGKRPDNFHNIASVALPIRLFDTLTFQAAQQNVLRLKVHGGGADIPCDERNIVVKALTLLREKYGIKNGALLQLFKKIPSQAGLGGGSSDASAALLLARRAWKLNITDDELMQLSASVGSDCPLFFCSTASLSTGRGETIRSLCSNRSLHFVLLKPPEGLSTVEVYKNCMPLHDRQFRSADDFLRCWQTGNLQDIGQSFFNRLEQPAQKLWNGFENTAAMFDGLDCLAVRMSGSGTAFYGLCKSRRHALWAVRQLRQRCANGEQVFAAESF
jgi:4-diphosphocytidyl-2-C-methyl-D-erythritol kinase